jgi:hypothetical protein
MQMLVENVDTWWQRIRDFCLVDPAGICWRIGQNAE